MDVDVRIPEATGWVEGYLQVPYAGGIGDWEVHWHHGDKQRDGSRSSPSTNALNHGYTPLMHSVDVGRTGELCVQVRMDMMVQRESDFEVGYHFFLVATGLDINQLGRTAPESYVVFAGERPDRPPPPEQLSC